MLNYIGRKLKQFWYWYWVLEECPTCGSTYKQGGSCHRFSCNRLKNTPQFTATRTPSGTFVPTNKVKIADVVIASRSTSTKSESSVRKTSNDDPLDIYNPLNPINPLWGDPTPDSHKHHVATPSHSSHDHGSPHSSSSSYSGGGGDHGGGGASGSWGDSGGSSDSGGGGGDSGGGGGPD